MCCGKRFPIQGYWERGIGHVPPTTIDWHEAETIYEDYVYMYGNSQSLERLAQRGGFGHNEGVVIREEAAAERIRRAERDKKLWKRIST